MGLAAPFYTTPALYASLSCGSEPARPHSLIQSTPVISRQLAAKILERELSGSPVISRIRAKAQTRDLRYHSPTFWRLHLSNPNSMLSDNGCTYISRNSADIDIAPATNPNKPYYILVKNADFSITGMIEMQNIFLWIGYIDI